MALRSRIKKQPMEFSKKILIISAVVAILLTIIVVVGSFFEFNMSEVAMLTGLVWGEVTASCGFYYWKAKNENRSKGICKLVRDLTKEHSIEDVSRIAEIIFKD